MKTERSLDDMSIYWLWIYYEEENFISKAASSCGLHNDGKMYFILPSLAKRQKEEIYWKNTKLLNLYHLVAIDLNWFHEVKFGVNQEMTE